MSVSALPLNLLLGPICPWRTVTIKNNAEGNNMDTTDRLALGLQAVWAVCVWALLCKSQRRVKTGSHLPKNKGQGIRLEGEKYIWEHITFREAWMSKKGLFRTLKGSLVLSICPSFIFSIRGEIISFSMHTSRILKSHWPTGWPWKKKKFI